jgi:ABC-2 type transport system permease protein
MDTSHLRTILWLRWRLSRNQWSRGGPLNAVLTLVVMGVGLFIGIGGGIAGLLAGVFLLAKVEPVTLLLLWDAIVLAFLFLWMIGLVSDIQRSETVDISRMLHLPISLRGVFVVNYLASHLTLSIILFLPGMLGLSLGLVVGRGASMLAMLPLVLGFVFMITAWTYCLRGWLVTLMMNPRRRRAVIAGVTFTFVLITQLPNFLGNVVFNHKHHRPQATESMPADEPNVPSGRPRDKMVVGNTALLVHKIVPVLWVGNGAMALATGSVWPAALGALGLFAAGALGLRRAYRSTVRFYQGSVKSKRPERKREVAQTVSRGTFLERQLPGVADDAAALALAFFRSLSRASEVKMMLATNFLMMLFFGAMITVRRSSPLADELKPFFATGAVVFTFFGLVQLMFNLFGLDRGGFRALVLLPVPRRQILLGKNLAFLPVAVGIGLALLIAIKFALGVSLAIILAAGLQLFSAFFLLSMLGNLASVLVPHRIAPGSLKPTKSSMVTTLMIFASHLLFPIAMLPIFVAPGLGLLFSRLRWGAAASTNLVVSVVVLGALALLYWASLDPLGDLLQRREKQILDIVTQEIE